MGDWPGLPWADQSFPVAELYFHTTEGLFVSVGEGTVANRPTLEIVTMRGTGWLSWYSLPHVISGLWVRARRRV